MTTPMNLLDFSSPNHVWTLSPQAVLRGGAQSDLLTGCSGLAGEFRVGVLRTRRVSVALYLEADHVWFVFDGSRYCLSDGTFSLTRHFVAPFVRRFSLKRNSDQEVVLHGFYRYMDINDSFPDDGDFLHYVARTVASRRHLVEFSCYWRIRGERAGELTSDDLDRVEECVRVTMTEVYTPDS